MTSMVCSRCGSAEKVMLEESRTMYDRSKNDFWDFVMDGVLDEDPNAPVPLCRDCAQMHHDWWDEQWAEYNSGRM